MNYCRILTLLFGLACLAGCRSQGKEKRQVQRSFYHWKTVFNPTPFEQSRMDTAGVGLLYTRFFDIDWDAPTSQPLPMAQIVFLQKIPPQTTIIPVVFITVDCIRRLDPNQTGRLAANMVSLIEKTCASAGIDSVKEIQIDCDWTSTTKDVYFDLLNKIKSQPFMEKKRLSVTIRLYQLKYSDRTGIPPADKGLLMCYNMGNLKDPRTKNSVLDPAETAKYISSLRAYPLEMDVALPLFEWKVLFRNGNYGGLIESLPDDSLQRDFIRHQDNRYVFTRNATIDGYIFMSGDELRDEKSDPADILAAASLVSRHLKNTHPVVSLYHLDSVILKKYSSHELETVFSSFD